MFEAQGSEIEALKCFSSDHLLQEPKTSPPRRLSEFDLEDVFRRELMDVSDAEDQVQVLLEQLDEVVGTPELRSRIRWLRNQTENHRRTLQRVVDAYSVGPSKRWMKTVQCLPVQALVTKILRAVKREASPGREMQLITDLQKFLHYAIAVYGSLCSWSDRIGDEDAAILFRYITDEKKDGDAQLTQIAETRMCAQ